MKYIHLRRCPDSDSYLVPYANRLTPPFGGATVAYEAARNSETGEVAVHIQIARCSSKDRYCKAIGRSTAAVKGIPITVVLPPEYDGTPTGIYNLVLDIARHTLSRIRKVR